MCVLISKPVYAPHRRQRTNVPRAHIIISDRLWRLGRSSRYETEPSGGMYTWVEVKRERRREER